MWLKGVECHGNEAQFDECEHSGWGDHDCSHFDDAGVICLGKYPYSFSDIISFGCLSSATLCVTVPGSQLAVRLAGGGNPLEGRVEVLYNGTWGTICDDYWNIRAADVVCRELGFNGADRVTVEAHFGRGSGPIWMDDVACFGTEASIFECSAVKWNNSDCVHAEDAGVVCYSRSLLVRCVLQ